MNGLFSLDMLRSVSGLAKNAAESLGHRAASIVGAADAPSFADVLASKKTSDSAISISEIRENLSSAIELMLTRMGVPIDPALSFVAGDDGTAHLESDHVRGAEIEANLQNDANVRTLVGKLLGSAVGADRRIVLHTIPAA